MQTEDNIIYREDVPSHLGVNEDFIKRFEDLLNNGTMVNTSTLEQYNKQVEQFNTQAKTSCEQLLKFIQTSLWMLRRKL